MPRTPKPGGVVFEPRVYAVNRKKFGHSSKRLSDGPIESPQQAAAELQHAVSNRIREYLLDGHDDLKSFCAASPLPQGLSYERFQRLLRGETMLSITDIMFWAREIPDLAEFIGATAEALSAPPAKSND